MKKKNISNSINKIACSAAGVVTAMSFYAGQAMALSSGVGNQVNNYKTGVRALAKYIGGLVGFGIIAFAVFNLVLAIRNEDAEGRNKALLNLVAGVALTAISVILGVFLK